MNRRKHDVEIYHIAGLCRGSQSKKNDTSRGFVENPEPVGVKYSIHRVCLTIPTGSPNFVSKNKNLK